MPPNAQALVLLLFRRTMKSSGKADRSVSMTVDPETTAEPRMVFVLPIQYSLQQEVEDSTWVICSFQG